MYIYFRQPDTHLLYFIMKKSKQLINKRRAFVKTEIEKARSTGRSVDHVINELSGKLFLSTRTIYQDYTAA